MSSEKEGKFIPIQVQGAPQIVRIEVDEEPQVFAKAQDFNFS